MKHGGASEARAAPPEGSDKAEKGVSTTSSEDIQDLMVLRWSSSPLTDARGAAPTEAIIFTLISTEVRSERWCFLKV
jgi:hypothetical protein